MTPLRVKRVYLPAEPADGTRILVDRLWPRGLTRDKARIDFWLKEIAPSDALRKRFHGRAEDWDGFRTAYADELRSPAAQAAATRVIALLRDGTVTLLYASRDEARNNAIALQDWLKRRSAGPI